MKVNCMRLRPNWMYEDRHIIGDMPLHSLMIPGTHNAGAYDANVGVSEDFCNFYFLPFKIVFFFPKKIFTFFNSFPIEGLFSKVSSLTTNV